MVFSILALVFSISIILCVSTWKCEFLLEINKVSTCPSILIIPEVDIAEYPKQSLSLLFKQAFCLVLRSPAGAAELPQPSSACGSRPPLGGNASFLRPGVQHVRQRDLRADRRRPLPGDERLAEEADCCGGSGTIPIWNLNIHVYTLGCRRKKKKEGYLVTPACKGYN